MLREVPVRARKVLDPSTIERQSEHPMQDQEYVSPTLTIEQHRRLSDPASTLKLHPKHRAEETAAISRCNASRSSDEIRKAYAEKKWKGVPALCGVLTMRQTLSGMPTTIETASVEREKFIKRLNRDVLDRLYRNGSKRLKISATEESGTENGGIHIHFQVEIPKGWSRESLEKKIRKCWKRTKLALHLSWIEPSEDPVRWEIYQGKQHLNETLFDLN